MGFFLSLKQNCPRSKLLAVFLLNIFQIQIICALIINFDTALYQNAVKFMFHHAQEQTSAINYGLLIINVLILGLALQQGNSKRKSFLYSKMVHTLTIKFIKIFPYTGFIPMVAYSLSTIEHCEITYKLIAGVNILFFIIFYQLNEISNWAYRFIQVDFCNQRSSNQFSFALIIILLIVCEMFSPLYASFIYLFRGLMKILVIFYHYDYPLIQKVDLFYGLYSIYLFGIVFGTSFFDINILHEVREFTILIFLGFFICSMSISPIILRLNYQRIKHSPQITLMDKDQRQSLPENLNKTIEESQNVLRILTNVFLERQKLQESEPNAYASWWQIFNRVVMIHRIQCQKKTCFCASMKNTPKAESMIFIVQLLKISQNLCLLNTKMYNLKIMSIYLFIQIAKKPLKAYYQIMRLKLQKINSDTQIQLEYLIKQTRQCFDQVFLKNKAKNQQLQLLKVIQYEQLMININKNMEDIIEDVIGFHELFLYSTIKTSSIKNESCLIFEKKKLLEEQVYNIIVNYSQNTRLNLIVFIFYRYLEVYKSKQAQIKKISSQQLLKKRIYQKNEANIFSPEFGSIFIDLVEQRGKILNLTSNMCDAYGYNREEMIGFNIKRFMPNIYARFHDRFLSNFVEKGKIKLLKQKERVIFAKNKRKFIFPVNVRLKAEYLLENQFGSSSLINAVQTNSEFMMVGPNGKLQQITENIYKKLFGNVFRDQVVKCNRLSVFKLLPSLNRIHDTSEETNPSMTNKIHEGILIYSQSQEMLNEKFRYARDLSMSGTATGSRTGTASNAGRMSVMSATNTSTGLMQQSQIIDFLTETFKAFLVDVNIFKLKGFKVSYKISTVHTSQFELTLIQFITFEAIEGINFYKSILNELKSVSEIYQLNQEHGPISAHLNEMEDIINQNKCQQYSLLPINQKQKKVDFTNNNDYQTELKRKRQSYERNGTLDNKHFDQLQNDNSENSLVEDELNKNQPYQEYERSEQSSIIGNTESESKKQILINAFNSKDGVVSKNTLYAMNFAILILIILLILLSVFSVSYVYENQYLWTDARSMLTSNQVVSFKIALVETQTFQKTITKTNNVSPFIKTKKLSSVTKLKQNLEDINKNTIDKGLEDNFYTQYIQMHNAFNNQTSIVTLTQFLNRYLYMLMYESQQNIQTLRNNYGSMFQIFSYLQNKKIQGVLDIQKFNFNRILILLGFYFLILLLTNIIIIPIYTYYKNEESNVIGLLSYMNVRQIRKSIHKLKQIKQLLKTRQSNTSVFYALFTQNTNEKRAQKQKSTDMEAKGTNKTLKITSEHDSNSIKITKIIAVLIFIVLFLSNFAVASFYITFNAEFFFRSNLRATQLMFQFQNKSPLLINTLISNVNRYLNKQPLIEYPEVVYKAGSEQFFAPVQELQKQEYKDSKISQLTREMFSSRLCQDVIVCSNTSTYNKSNTISLEYLIYQFKERFKLLLPEEKYTLTNSSIKAWIDQNKIQNFVLWLDEVMTMARNVNILIDGYFVDQAKNLQLKLLICALVLIPLNIALIIYVETKFLKFLNSMLVESEQIFRHFSVAVLVENTYLTSYFNSKIKQNK